ncbi:LppU/SCO3897 family protein [Streptomyces griseoflavus]|uniref:LppU/SCO3897 family protein n=1 Tax=Streptomyces griseoflavus TaxID=35619 RepID=UPI0033BBDFD9
MTTPPPQGNPFAQGQPQGNPFAQGQAPDPSQGGFPQQGGQPGFPPPGAPVPPPQQGRKLSFKTIKNIVIVLIIAGVAIGTYITSQDDADTAAVGDCMHRGSTDDNNPDLEVVDCGDAKAQYKVLAKVEGNFSGLTAQTKCEAESKDFQYSYTETNGSKSFLLCLKDK